MTDKVQLNRRTFLAANAAVAAAATVPAQAVACAKAEHSASAAPLSWETVTSDQMASLIGDRFRVKSEAAGEVVMQLVSVEPGGFDPARPTELLRQESLIAVFDSPDKEPLVACGGQIHRVTHPRLGGADLYFQPSCLRKGGHVLEMVLG
ncbi:MAG: twin-arginine translocation signal domain-containing protein [Pseudomonadota bacterium]